MNLYVRALLSGICVSVLIVPVISKRPKPPPEDPPEDCVIAGDIVSVILEVDEWGNIIAITNGAEITMGSRTQVELWLSAEILAIDDELLENHVIGTDPLWPSGDDPPLWIEGDYPLEFAPNPWLVPEWNDDLQRWGRYYFGEARLIKGEDDSRFDFDFSPHGPCTNPWGDPLPVDDDPAIWDEWRQSGEEDSPPICPFGLVLLGGLEDSDTGNVTFAATSELFLVRKGGYPRVLLVDFTLGPLCPKKGPIPPDGCIKDTGGYIVGTGPVEDPIVFDFSQN